MSRLLKNPVYISDMNQNVVLVLRVDDLHSSARSFVGSFKDKIDYSFNIGGHKISTAGVAGTGMFLSIAKSLRADGSNTLLIKYTIMRCGVYLTMPSFIQM